MSNLPHTPSPRKLKNALKHMPTKLSFDSVESSAVEEFPKIKRSSIKRRKSEEIRNKFKFKIKTEEEKENEQKITTKLFRQFDPCDVCIDALKYLPNHRTEQQIKIISYYLQLLKNFMIIFKDQIQNEELEEFLYNISSLLIYENSPKNRFIFKFGEKAEKFYIILKGKVEFCVPKENKVLMNEEEYILFLSKLRFNEENELIKKNLENNKISFNYGDNFDQFVLRVLNKQEKEKEVIYSQEIYSCFKKIRELFIEKKNKIEDKDKYKINDDEITIEEYLQRSSFNEIIDKNINININEVKKIKKLLNIFHYEKTNTYEDGDCFGLSSPKMKGYKNKRSTTAISTENCELAVLDKNVYIQLLEKITKKAKEKLYKLVISHKIFNHISLHTFNNKYCHMFRFTRFYFNNDIMNESNIFDKIIIFISGEFILSVNKNILELNELIIKIKKLRGNLRNFSEKVLKNDLTEIEENEDLENTTKYASHNIIEYINKRQNLVISTVNDKMLFGFPDTVDQSDFIPFFNCKCISNTATGYVVEREMIQLFKRDGYLRETPPKIVFQKIDFYLKRLLEHKKNIMNRIQFLKEQDNKLGNKNDIKININLNKSDNNNNSENIYNNINNNIIKLKNKDINDINNNKEIEEKNDINNDEMLLNITRNNLKPINIKNNNNFPFQAKKLINQIDPSYLPYQPKTIIKEQKKEKENYIIKYKEGIKKKKYLLKLSQLKSPKFNQKERAEIKKFQVFLNKYGTKDEYNDISSIFSKDPNKNNSILNKYRKHSEDNVLDAKIYSLKKQLNNEKFNLILPKSNKTTELNTISNISNNLDVRNKYIITPTKNEKINNNSNIILRNKNINGDLSLNPISINNSEIKNIKIKYNNLSLDVDKINDDLNVNKLNKSKFKHLYNELFTDYIYTQLNEDNKNKKIYSLNKKYQKMDNFKLNKIQLKKIKNKFISNNNKENNIINKGKNKISIVDPLYLEKLGDKYNKK